MTITETSTGDMLTMRIDIATLSGPANASLHGRMRYAIIDGLLWWALGRKLDALVAAAMRLPIHHNEEQAQALHVGEALVAYVTTTPWEESDDDRAARIYRTMRQRLPELAPLCALGQDHAREHSEATALVELLQARLAHPGDAGHGLDGILQPPVQKAA